MIFNYYRKYINAPLRKFGALTTAQLKHYAAAMTDEPVETIEKLLDNMEHTEQIEISADVARLSPWVKFDRKTLIAFWVLVQFAKPAGENYFQAEYPSQIGFVADEVYLITVCDNPKYDKELVALMAKKNNPNIKHIIVGVNMELNDINEAMLPTTEFIFASCRVGNLLTEVPEINAYRVGAKTEK